MRKYFLIIFLAANVFSQVALKQVKDFTGITPGFGLSIEYVKGANGLPTGAVQVNVDTALLGQRVAPPPTSNTTCTVGSWAASTDYYYICVTKDTWRRTALASW